MAQKSPLAVRLAKINANSLREANDFLKGPSFNLLLNDLVVEVVRLTQSNPFAMGEARLLTRLRQDSQLRDIFEKIRRRDVTSSVPNNETMSAKLPLLFTERQRIQNVARQLRWTVAQVIIEALQAASVLVGAEKAIPSLPHLIAKYRASMVYEGFFEAESAAQVLEKINLGLGLLGKPDLSPVPKPEEQLKSYVDLV